MPSEALQRNAEHEARLSNIWFRSGDPEMARDFRSAWNDNHMVTTSNYCRSAYCNRRTGRIPRQLKMRTKIKQQGFTLLEIMIVVSIIVVLLGLAISKMGNPTGFAKQTAVRADVQSIGTQLQLYESMNGFYPTTEQGLQGLVTQSQNDPRPTRWYQFFKQVPKDPWGSDYVYRSPGLKNPGTYDLYSAGPDRIPDTPDDDWGQ